MWMSVKEAIVVSMDARTLWAGIDVAAHKAINNIISGTNVWVSDLPCSFWRPHYSVS